MDTAVSPLPDDIEALKALVLAATRKADLATQRAADAEARLDNAQAQASATEAMIAHLKLQIVKLRREQYGPSAERTRRLLDQMELQLGDLEAARLNGLDPYTWLNDVLERIVTDEVKNNDLDCLLPWNWRPTVDPAMRQAA